MRKKREKDMRLCHNCKHHYDEHSKAKDGRMILCRCPFFKFSRLQYYERDSCDKYEV